MSPLASVAKKIACSSWSSQAWGQGAFGYQYLRHNLSVSPGTGSTQTVEHHIVSFQEKIGGYEGLDILGTALDLVHLATFATLEMVMMGLRGSLIVRRLTGQFHLDEPPFFNESFEGALDRGNA
jgi:hypothetical protein